MPRSVYYFSNRPRSCTVSKTTKICVTLSLNAFAVLVLLEEHHFGFIKRSKSNLAKFQNYLLSLER